MYDYQVEFSAPTFEIVVNVESTSYRVSALQEAEPEADARDVVSVFTLNSDEIFGPLYWTEITGCSEGLLETFYGALKSAGWKG